MKYQLYLHEPLPDDLDGACATLADSFGMSAEQVAALLERAPGVITRPLPLADAEDTLDFVLAAGFHAELHEAEPSRAEAWREELGPAPTTPVMSEVRGPARRAVLQPFLFSGLIAIVLYVFLAVPWFVTEHEAQLERYAALFASGVVAASDGLPLSAPAAQGPLRAEVNGWSALDDALAAAIIIDGSAAYVGGFNHTEVSNAALVRERSANRGREYTSLSGRLAANRLVLQAITQESSPTFFGSAAVPRTSGGQVLVVGNSEQAMRPVLLGALGLLAVLLFGMLLAVSAAARLSARVQRGR